MESKLTPFTIRPAQVTVPKIEVAMEIAELAQKCGAEFVNIKEVTTIRRYPKNTE